MVWPDIEVTTSPGRQALPPGMFSTAGTMPMTLSGKARRARVLKTPSTLPPPLMSYFISSRSAPGLSEMPPVSKVRPLPTSTIGLAAASPPR